MSASTVVVLGGTGIFGARVAAGLARTPGLHVVVAGRNPKSGKRVASRLGVGYRPCDLADSASLRLCLQGAALLVHAAGPFQGQGYEVAEACLEAGVHYLDLADARDFVCGIGSLDARAKERKLVIGAGASSVPTITHALVREIASDLTSIDAIDLALSPGNRNPRGGEAPGRRSLVTLCESSGLFDEELHFGHLSTRPARLQRSPVGQPDE